MDNEHSSGPLAGVRVVDFGHYVAGPYAAHLLGDLGATVVKAQRLRGDPMSGLRDPYAAVNRGKLSLAIDLRAPAAADVIRRLVSWSDVVVHNFRPHVAERLGFGREQLRAIDPSVVLLESTAYGFDGPWSDRPAFDPTLWGLGGHAWRAGGPTGPPVCNTRLGPIDCGTGALGAFAAAAALYRARRTGVGGSVAVSLMDTSLFLAGDIARDANGPVGATTVDHNRAGTHPAEALYELADCWVAVVAVAESARQELAIALGLPALAERPSSRWTAHDGDQIRATLRSFTRRQLADALAGRDVLIAPCVSDARARILASEPLLEAGLVVRSEDTPHDAYVGFPVTFDRSGLAGSQRTHVPTLGEHTDEVLRMIGLDDEQVNALYQAGVVQKASAG